MHGPISHTIIQGQQIKSCSGMECGALLGIHDLQLCKVNTKSGCSIAFFGKNNGNYPWVLNLIYFVPTALPSCARVKLPYLLHVELHLVQPMLWAPCLFLFNYRMIDQCTVSAVIGSVKFTVFLASILILVMFTSDLQCYQCTAFQSLLWKWM